MIHRNLLAMGILASLFSAAAEAQEVRYFQDELGRDIRETKRVVKVPVSETVLEERERTVYREEYTTELEETTRMVYVPVTEYRREFVWKNRFNPFSTPYMVEQLVPHTHYEWRTEIVKRPVTKRDLIPVQQVFRVPRTERYLVEREKIDRVVLNSPRSSSSSGALVQREPLGGRKLESDPPRSGSETVWRQGETGTRR